MRKFLRSLCPCRHDWQTVSFKKNGKIEFCGNCARPGYTLVERCTKCRAERSSDGWVVPDDKTFALTPEVAALCRI